MATRFDDWEGQYLEHYGVLGMKWGQRRFQNKDGSLTAAGKKHYAETGEYGYQYHSHTTKKYNRKAAKAEAKGKTAKAEKMKRRAARSEELDRREQEYAQRVRTSGNIAMRLLTKTIGGKAYQQHLAMNKDTTSRGSKLTASLLNFAAGRAGSMVRKAMYLRQDERAAKRAAKGKAADRGAAFRERAAAAKAAFESSVNQPIVDRNAYERAQRTMDNVHRQAEARHKRAERVSQNYKKRR